MPGAGCLARGCLAAPAANAGKVLGIGGAQSPTALVVQHPIGVAAVAALAMIPRPDPPGLGMVPNVGGRKRVVFFLSDCASY